MDSKNYMESLPTRDIYYFINSHIKDLVSIKKNLNEQLFKELQNSWDMESSKVQLNKDDVLAWRGAKVQVINAKKGLNHRMVKETINVGIRYDEPCPSRYPRLLSGLIMRIQEDFQYYYMHVNKYMFYELIARTSYALEKKYKDLSKLKMCKEILTEQIKLLTDWKMEFANYAFFERLNNISTKNCTYYFAFGVNCNQKTMYERCPNAKKIGESILYNYELIIDDRGQHGGCASVKSKEGSSVTGILWHIPNEEIKSLDRAEGVNMNPPSYRKEFLKVHVLGTDSFQLESLVYISLRKEGFYAKKMYIENILKGFKESLIQNFDESKYKKHIN